MLFGDRISDAVSVDGGATSATDEAPPAGLFVALVMMLVVLCALLCCLRRGLRPSGAGGRGALPPEQHASPLQEARLESPSAKQRRETIVANIVGALKPTIATQAAQELCQVGENEGLVADDDASARRDSLS